jgi:hypothetical protein
MFMFIEAYRPRTARPGPVSGGGSAAVASPETTEQALARFGAECGWSDAASRLAGAAAVDSISGDIGLAVSRPD